MDSSVENRSDAIEPTKFRPPSATDQLPRLRFPWLRMLLGLFVVIGSWATWYVMTSNSVEIVTTPADATVSIDELVAPRLAQKWILRPGSRRVIATASGYVPFVDDIEISDEPMQRHQITLEPLPGHLRIEISPLDSAAVVVDDTPPTEAPTTIRELKAGPHQVVLEAPRYKKFETIVEIEGRDIEQLLSVELQPAWADASFDSVPQGARVSVDGEALGTTPLNAELIEGIRNVQLDLQGYKSWRRKIDVVAGQALDVPQVLLSKADGFVSVTTTPPGTSITVDGNYQGTSPLKVAVKPDQKHTIKAIKPGYLAASRSITATSGETMQLSLTLKPELAAVRFIIAPEDAELLIDGKLQAQANQSIKLPTHEHTIEVRRAGMASFETKITPRKGVEKRVRVRLRPSTAAAGSSGTAAKQTSSQASAAPLAGGASTKTSLGQEMKLFRGGDVTMGSSRRDPARRANEAIREATLRRPFYLAVKEVTNGDFRQFLANHISSSKSGQSVNDDKQPVALVSWNTAAMFCNWLSRRDSLPEFYQIKNGKVLGVNPSSTGYRLPTEAEWAWAARISSDNEPFKYPWAGKYPPQGRSGNFADQSAARILGRVISDYNDGFVASAPVGSFPPNLHGLHDMGGNVAEWVHDYYAAAPNSSGRLVDPLGPRSGTQHVIKGSSWAHAGDTELRLAFRDSGNDPRDDVGFRIARYAQ